MKASHFIVNGDNVLGVIYDSDKFGKVIVFRTSVVDLERLIEIYDVDKGSLEKEDILELVMSVLPK